MIKEVKVERRRIKESLKELIKEMEVEVNIGEVRRTGGRKTKRGGK